MEKTSLLIEAHYLPCVEYFCNILLHDDYIVEVEENYQKQSYRNRCKILTANKIDVLTVPIVHGQHKLTIKEAKIENMQNWQKTHWRTIQSAYGNSPFFEYYADSFGVIFNKSYIYLLDLNLDLLTLCLNLLKISKEIKLTNTYTKTHDIVVNDLRNVTNAKNDNRPYPNFVFEEYIQVFGSKFAPNLSIIDLICCEGPNSSNILATILKKSRS